MNEQEQCFFFLDQKQIQKITLSITIYFMLYNIVIFIADEEKNESQEWWCLW